MCSYRYKWCLVPDCKSTSVKTPQKLFIKLPHDIKMRKTWLRLAKRDPKLLSSKSIVYFCEDHFDLEYYMENYMQYKIMGSVKRIKMKPNCTPTRFECQSERKRTYVTPINPRSTVVKRQRVSLSQKTKSTLDYENWVEIPSSYCEPAAAVEHRTGVRAQLFTEMTKQSEQDVAPPPSDIKINVDRLKQEPGLAQVVKREPLVKEEILEDKRQASDTYEQDGVLGTLTSDFIGRTSVAAECVERDKLLRIKEELEDTDLDIGPTVLQHMDSQYTTDQIDSNSIKLKLDPDEVLSGIDDGRVVFTRVRDAAEDLKRARRGTRLLRLGTGGTRVPGLWYNRPGASARSAGCDAPATGPRAQAYTCHFCQKTFWTKQGLRYHAVSVHTASVHRCLKCNRNFKYLQYLQQHERFIHSKPKYKCEVCQRLFKARYNFTNHCKSAHS